MIMYRLVMAVTSPHWMVIDGLWSSSGIMITGVKPKVPREKTTSVTLLPQ
jgi:hypothetical protein